MSQRINIIAPRRPLDGIKYLASLPINLFIICGERIPIKPITPTNETLIAQISDAKNNEISLTKLTLIPKLIASSSPEYKALYFEENNIKIIKQIKTIINITKSLVKFALDKSPKEKYTLEARSVSLAKNCKIVVIAPVRLVRAIPLTATILGVKFLIRLIVSKNIVAPIENINAIGVVLSKLDEYIFLLLNTIIEIVAPSKAELLTPKVDGLASGFLKFICIIKPLIAKPKPINKAARDLLNLILKIIS